MAILSIHTRSGHQINAPFEAWVVALINALPPQLQNDLFARIQQMEGASLIPDKYLLTEDELGTVHMVERPVIDLRGKI